MNRYKLWDAALISLIIALLRPFLLSRIQHEVSNHIRATVFSMQSLVFALLLVVSEPLLGLIADQSGLPAVYVGLAGVLGILMLLLFWKTAHIFHRRV